MSLSPPPTVLCIASYEKGQEFMRECKRQGCRTLLLTSASLKEADWPRESLDDIFYIHDEDKRWQMSDAINGVSYLARTTQIDRIIALDDFDVEKAANLREHLRVPGMGDTTARYFRDKLAMRMKAQEEGIAVPRFVHILNYDKINSFLNSVPAPYVLKPRSQAGAVGIQKIHSAEELWKALELLSDQQSHFLLEEFIKGDIFHVDSIVNDKKVLFSLASKYGLPPMEVSHQGRVFTTRTIKRGSADEKALTALNKTVLKKLGLVRGVSHTEYIKAEDGTYYFLETSARVGGAHIAEMVEGATGMNLWAEWAKLETTPDPADYEVPNHRKEYAGLMVSLAKQEWPDLSGYNAPEVFWRMHKRQHAGIVVHSPSYERVEELINAYVPCFYEDFFASAPPAVKAGY